MRKKLALLLVLALVITLVPMSAFAASDNSIDRVPKVADDHVFDNVYNTAPVLTIKEKNEDEFGNTEQVFRLKLENAEWLEDEDFFEKDQEVVAGTFEKKMGKEDGSVVVKRLTNTTVQVAVYDTEGSTDKKVAFKIPMLAKLKGKGEAKVTVDPRNSAVSGGTYVFAIGGSGDTITTVADVESFADICEVADIEIDETNAGALPDEDDQEITLKLPSNFKWRGTKTNNSIKVFGTGGLSKIKSSVTEIDGRTLKLEIDYTTASDRSQIGTIYITGLQLEATKNAKPGDVVMTISGDGITKEDVVIAKYVDYDVTVEATDDPEELFSGRWDVDVNDPDADVATTDSDEHKLTKLVIEEEVANSWLTTRKTRIEFPSWIKIFGVKVTDRDNFSKTKAEAIEKSVEVGDNAIEFTIDKENNAKTAMLELQFYVSIEAGRSGDIEAVVGGRALPDEQTVVLGKAIAPVSVEVKPADVRTGVKKQALNKIVITENKEEAIQKGELILTLEDGEWSNVPDVEVVEGNIDIDVDSVKVDGNELTIKVKGDSSKASTIEITNAAIDLYRSVPEGEIELYVQGNSVVQNYHPYGDDDLCMFKEDSAATAVVAKVVTPADPNVGVKEVVFTIGDSTFTVDGVEQVMDTAPYIKDGRTMLPVRYVAQALGVPEDNVVWNPVTRTVTIFKGDRVVLITIGSAELKVNGTPIYMDTVAEIKDGRTMLPISFIGKALGAEVTWDAEARTVTIK